MPHITLDQINAENDILTGSDFTFYVALPSEVVEAVESSLFTSNIGRSLAVLCETVTLPSKTIPPMEIQLFGHAYKHYGKREPYEAISATFIETSYMPIYKALYAWNEYLSLTETGDAGADKFIGANNSRTVSDIYVNVMSVTGQRVGQFIMYNAWPTSIEGVELSGQGGDAIRCSVSFEYDYFLFREASLGEELVDVTRGIINSRLPRIFG